MPRGEQMRYGQLCSGQCRVLLVSSLCFFICWWSIASSERSEFVCVSVCCSESGDGTLLPKVNWSIHDNAHDHFSDQSRYLSSNFLYSLPNQKPSSQASMSSRYLPTVASVGTLRAISYFEE